MAKRAVQRKAGVRRAQKGSGACVVLVTCESKAQAAKIAHAVVEKRLAACANVLSAPVESVYRWKNKIETAAEFLLIIKTVRARLKALEEAVSALHSYEVPEFLALEAPRGSVAYLKWITENT
jgi:periplasmic divalent cation tolerance protein